MKDNNFFFGFNKNSELTNGRIAMIGFILLIFFEVYGRDRFYCFLCLFSDSLQ